MTTLDSLSIWIVIVGLTLVTIGTRSFFLVLGSRFPLPERVQHALRYAPVCALVALVAPELFIQQDTVAVSLANFKLAAGGAAVIAMLVSRSMIVTMAIGMGVFTALRFL